MYDSETHQQTRAHACIGASRSAATSTVSILFHFSVFLVYLSHLNCGRPTFDVLVYPDPRVSICCFRARYGTGRHQLAFKPAVSVIILSTLVVSREVTAQ